MAMAGPTDEDLMLAARRGDRDAFARLVERHQSRVWALASRFLQDRTEAEDVAQQAFLRILEAAPRYEPSARFTTYLYGVVKRLCMDHAEKRRPRVTDDLEATASAPSPADAAALQEQEDLVRRALARLPENQRMAVLLRHYEGLGYREIAGVLETTEKAVERLLARARDSLEGLLAKVWQT